MGANERLDLTEVMTRLAGLLFSEETLQSALDMTSRLSHEVLPQTTGAGVTLIRRGTKLTAAYTDEIVERADALQYELEEGPCLSAWRENTVFRIDDLETDERWPRWASGAVAMGLRSCLSAPLRAGDAPNGAIKVYSMETSAYDASHESVLQMLADQAGIVLANVQGTSKPRRSATSSRTHC